MVSPVKHQFFLARIGPPLRHAHSIQQLSAEVTVPPDAHVASTGRSVGNLLALRIEQAADTAAPATPAQRLASGLGVLPDRARRGESAEGREPMARERLQSP